MLPGIPGHAVVSPDVKGIFGMSPVNYNSKIGTKHFVQYKRML